MSTTANQSGMQSGSNPKSLPPELQKAMSKVTDIASLPEITTRIVEVVEDPKATAHDMHEIVRSDPALATKILKVVNSAFYGLPSQIASLDRAIIMLGLSAVKNIALAASLTRFFKGGELSEHFAARDLWQHSIAVGVCAKSIADKVRYAQEEAFVGGLVHDMGLLVIQQLFADRLKEVAEKCYAEPQNFLELETSLIGADHQAFGVALATKWKFPPALRYVVSYHHDPHLLKPEFQRLTSIIYIADTICCQNKIGFWLTGATQALTEEVLGAAMVTPDQLQEVAQELPERLQEAEQIFNE